VVPRFGVFGVGFQWFSERMEERLVSAAKKGTEQRRLSTKCQDDANPPPKKNPPARKMTDSIPSRSTAVKARRKTE